MSETIVRFNSHIKRGHAGLGMRMRHSKVQKVDCHLHDVPHTLHSLVLTKTTRFPTYQTVNSHATECSEGSGGLLT